MPQGFDPKQRRHKVKAHERKAPTRRPPQPPMPGANEFSPEQETAMRQGQRDLRTMAPGDDLD